MEKSNTALEDWPIISSYTREEALDDGVLVDLTQTDEWPEAGFKIPGACTIAVWALINPEAMPSCQDMNGRLWDVCTMFKNAIRRNGGGREIMFEVLFKMGNTAKLTNTKLKAVCGPGDNAGPVITIMLPEED